MRWMQSGWAGRNGAERRAALLDAPLCSASALLRCSASADQLDCDFPATLLFEQANRLSQLSERCSQYDRPSWISYRGLPYNRGGCCCILRIVTELTYTSIRIWELKKYCLWCDATIRFETKIFKENFNSGSSTNENWRYLQFLWLK